MTVDQTATFLAVLASIAGISALFAIVATALSLPIVPTLRAAALPLAAAVAVAATASSLYLSEVAHFVPCTLCWYQRIAMYPLAVILTIAAVRRDAAIKYYVLPLSLGGLAVSVWHVIIERVPSAGSCDPANPCSIRWIEQWGFLTIPTMAGICFFAITVALFLARSPSPEPRS